MAKNIEPKLRKIGDYLKLLKSNSKIHTFWVFKEYSEKGGCL